MMQQVNPTKKESIPENNYTGEKRMEESEVEKYIRKEAHR